MINTACMLQRTTKAFKPEVSRYIIFDPSYSTPVSHCEKKVRSRNIVIHVHSPPPENEFLTQDLSLGWLSARELGFVGQ